jgi:transposase InsO family protein
MVADPISSTLFYASKKENADWDLKIRIEETLRAHPAYGHRRVALHLHENKKKIQRVMQKYGLKPYRRRVRKWKKPRKQAEKYPNLLMQLTPAYPHQVWVADFTHLNFKGRDVCVATVMDVFTRRVVGVAVATSHTAALTIAAVWSALLANPRPLIFHSDNGVEYNARAFKEVLTSFDIRISRSAPGCPWENGYQESFYDKFKIDLGDPNRFHTLGELVAEVYATVHAYNTTRIHSALKMSPLQFARLHQGSTMH